MYRRLFEKGMIGTARIKNRLVMTSMTLGYAGLDGQVSDAMIRYYEERAKGGIGLIMTEIFRVNDEHGRALPNQVSVATAASQVSMNRLTKTVHKYDTRIFAQLHHGGNTNSPDLNGGLLYSASDVPSPSGLIPTPFSTDQVKELITQFIHGARFCQMAGFDGVELHGAHGYLINQFMSEHYNHRSDAYGGSFENRMRFPAEIIRGIKETCGRDFPVVIRMNGEEFLSDTQEGTITLTEGVKMARAMEEAGADAIDVSVSTYFSSITAIEPYSFTPGWRKYVTKAIKDAVGVPVIGTNTIKDPAFAESLLAEGISDFIGLGRSQLADPQWARKAYEGREDEIRMCLGCLYCFESLMGKGSASCAINPYLGYEGMYDEMVADGANRPVAVVGGGPAGMQAAITLAQRGFAVTLYEKHEELGGTLNVADKVAGYKDKVTKFKDTLVRQMELSGVTLKLGREATPEEVARITPVAVFLAIGAKPLLPPIPGVHKDHVCQAIDVLAGRVQPKGHCVIIGSGLTGLEAAEYLQQRDLEVTIVEMQDTIGPGIYPIILMDIMSRLQEHPLHLYPKHRLAEIGSAAVTVTNLETGTPVEIEADTVILALGVVGQKDAAKAFDERFEQVVVIGDASTGGRISDATSDGLTYASGFEPL